MVISDGSVADRLAQAALRGASLSQFAIAINGIRLSFWGEGAASVCHEVHVEQSVVRVVSGAGDRVVDPDDAHEAWQIGSDDGLRIVCAPGGEVSTWRPRER
ncbi:DUF6188 family protein [Cellulosimicrobium cellulans]|uniref:DUF6188 family protein n=1 Tax=Cellulosimicrobium cellulans TaxID=1710 RepID=UPI0036EF9A57